jgi:hypothetical protein
MCSPGIEPRRTFTAKPKPTSFKAELTHYARTLAGSDDALGG